MEETKICCHHFTWVRSRIRTCSNHEFGELQVAKNAINSAVSFAVHLLAIAQTFEFLHSCEDHGVSILNGFRSTSDHNQICDNLLVGSRANWVPQTNCTHTQTAQAKPPVKGTRKENIREIRHQTGADKPPSEFSSCPPARLCRGRGQKYWRLSSSWCGTRQFLGCSPVKHVALVSKSHPSPLCDLKHTPCTRYKNSQQPLGCGRQLC